MGKILLSALLSLLSFASFAGGTNYVESDFFGEMRPGDRAAILMVHFGTTHDDTRALTIDALNDRVREAFPDVELREAYTSRIVIKRLGERGVKRLNLLRALEKLHADGFTHILIQSSVVIDGVEMESLERDVDQVRALFRDVRVGTPLLYAPADYEAVIEALTDERPDAGTACVWVGHGTYDATTAQYAMLDYMLKSKGFADFHVGTIEGYPAFEEEVARLKASGIRRVQLVPLMFVAGEHAKNDIAGDWKGQLEEEGFNVSVSLCALGEIPAVREIYLSHLRFAATHRHLDIMEKKSTYEQTGEKF